MVKKSRLTFSTEKPYTSYNPYFLIPFLIWVVVGGLSLIFFDRRVLFEFANGRHSEWGDVLMTYITNMGEGPFVLVVLLILLGRTSFRNLWFFITALFSNVLPNIMTQAVKSGVNAPRPLNYYKEAPWIHISPDWPRYMERSFPSGHTTAAFCLFSFLAILLPEKYRHWGLVFFFMAIAVGYSRMYLAAHFFIDVYVGSIIATVFVVCVVTLMNRNQGRFFKQDYGIH
ncbi:phosphatase PAP2 family protein [Polluticoccus soli]|uniref:phosphatase PAP2 family protein n=1 Tax=Polluticoccus soli TaxID=3034150 RepID=UPI0023E33AE6|nr:phosphatase PAP2 family protein [Flavipsychrobacter sp. JY13-12]